ncbi:MAG: ABC transporter permease [Vicinamibacterales bacterium]
MSAGGTHVAIIRPSGPWVSLRLAEVWEFRELLYFLVWRDIKVRYKQTALGVTWAIVQPLFTMLVFSVFFGRLGRLPSDGLPYPVFAFCALIPWQLFAFSLVESSNSVVTNQRLFTKVYFPRLVMPIAALGVGLIDFAVGFGVLAGMIAYYGVVPGWAVLTLPVWTMFAVLTALAAGLWLSALNVVFRDVRYVLPFFSQLWMFATPVAYSTAIIPDAWRPIYAINPMVSVVDGFRWALLGTPPSSALATAVSAIVVAVMLAGGLYYFRRMERTFADVV